MIARTAVLQGPGLGQDYPFQGRTSASLLFLDLYVHFSAALCATALPLRLDAADGFGTGAGDPVSHRHARDLVITDADGAVLVATSVAGVTFREALWGERTVSQWHNDAFVVRAVWRHVAADDFSPHETPDVPLDPRTWQQAPLRLTGVQLDNQVFTGPLTFRNGYNTTWTLRPAAAVDGSPLSYELVLAATPGSGLGPAPGCFDAPPNQIRTVNQIAPSPGGLFALETGDCHRLSLSETPGSQGWQLHNDCKTCQPCAAFEAAYNADSRMFRSWWRLGQQAEAAAATYHANRDRWLAARLCRREQPVQLTVLTQAECRTAVSGRFCNVTPCCLYPVELRFTFRRLTDGVPAAAGVGGGYDAFIEASSTDGEEAYALGGAWPVFRIFFDGVDPQTAATVRFRTCGDCGADDALEVTLSVHAADPGTSVDGQPCDLPSAEDLVSGDVRDVWDTESVDGDPVIAAITRTLPLDPEPLAFNCGCG